MKNQTGRQNRQATSQKPQSRGGVVSRGKGIMTPTNNEMSQNPALQNQDYGSKTTTFGNLIQNSFVQKTISKKS